MSAEKAIRPIVCDSGTEKVGIPDIDEYSQLRRVIAKKSNPKCKVYGITQIGSNTQNALPNVLNNFPFCRVV